MLLGLVGLPVEQPFGRSQTDTCDLHAAFGGPDFGVDTDVADQNYLIYHNL